MVMDSSKRFSQQSHHQRLQSIQNRLNELEKVKKAEETELVSNHGVSRLISSKTLWVSIDGQNQSGALGKHSGKALLRSLSDADSKQNLVLLMDSAGAHLKEPLHGLKAVNRLLERLWELKSQKLKIIAIIPCFAYGGTALSLCTTSDQIILGPQAQISLLGPGLFKNSDDLDNLFTSTKLQQKPKGIDYKTTRVSKDSVADYLSAMAFSIESL